jgi:hypothetical protein
MKHLTRMLYLAQNMRYIPTPRQRLTQGRMTNVTALPALIKRISHFSATRRKKV